MEVTEKKLAANRANAQKSTGPKTDEGKQTVSQNSVKHGLYTRALILNSPDLKEDLTEYNGLIYSLVGELRPEGILEDLLVRQIANCIWRSRRAILAENSAIIRQLNRLDDDLEQYVGLRRLYKSKPENLTPEKLDHFREMLVGEASIPSSATGSHIQRFEMRLDRQMNRALKILEGLQKRRRTAEREENTDILKSNGPNPNMAV